MANALYDKYRQTQLEGGASSVAWLADTIKPVLVDSELYTPNLATHQYLSDIPAGARVATGAALTGKTSTTGVADANDAVFTAASGPQSEYVVLYKDTGVATTSNLICLLDTLTGLPVTPNGGDITVIFPNDANKIFKI
jgi:hypothetical protein